MTTKNVYLQDSDSSNLLPVTDWSNLLNVPSTLQSTDKILTSDNFNNKDIFKMTSHELVIGSGFSGSGKLITFQLNGVPFWSISLAVTPTADWTMSDSTPLCTTPDISNDEAVKGTPYTIVWKYLPAYIWQIISENYGFAFHDGYGYVTSSANTTIKAGYQIMVFGTQMLMS
ncbi:UNVERIFIED_CONTAM: hypothetical protein HCY04_04545 [Limosilactobacillus fermentum]